jgi:hypothetical protein
MKPYRGMRLLGNGRRLWRHLRGQVGELVGLHAMALYTGMGNIEWKEFLLFF